jgi:secreted PhoX family phosphatase
VLDGVDNIIVSSAHDLYVAEDGGNMEVVIITPDLVVAPVVRIVDPASTGYENGTPVPTSSEVTGLAFSPDGTRLYLNSQRGGVFGILYEVRGPWRTAGDSTGPRAPADPRRVRGRAPTRHPPALRRAPPGRSVHGSPVTSCRSPGAASTGRCSGWGPRPPGCSR